LVVVFAGFCNTAQAIAQAMVLDVVPNETIARQSMWLYGCTTQWSAYMAGKNAMEFFFTYLDYDGTFIAFFIMRLIRLIYVLIDCTNTLSIKRDWEVEETQCWVKSLYYALYMWPQGVNPEIIPSALAYMVHNRYHWNSAAAGWVTFGKAQQSRSMQCVIYETFCYFCYVPTIGIMFITILFTGNPFYGSWSMDLLNVFRNTEGFEAFLMFFYVYPAFVGTYVKLTDLTVYLGVMEGLKHLGEFLAMSRWPNQLFCGDPMACWRSQYLYSHAIFYNTNGDQGNIMYVTWYCMSKSQRRQCCCPYRKLKPDAPNKCCPPCCMGPLVEEDGGCPCPCCCSSCAS
jgi:hypothetical protein